MLKHNPFYFSLLRKYSILIGTLFNDIKIERIDDNDSSKNQIIKVPVEYAGKQKVLARFEQDPKANRDYSLISPTISFKLDTLYYDATRMLPKYNKTSFKDINDSTKRISQYVPVPYNFVYNVSIYVKNTEDGTRIIEQILPFFNPDINISTHLIENSNEVKDISIVLNEIKHSDNYDGKFDKRESIIWDLTLTLKGYLYGPEKSQSIIKFVNTSIYVSTSNTDNLQDDSYQAVKILTTPGLTANGNPTNNSSESISPLLINIEDDFGYCTDITEYTK